mgnify:CR=1 FL=1
MVTGPTPVSVAVRTPARSLYVHMPFCFHKCHYCDFYSIVDQQDRMGAFAEALIADLRHASGWARTGKPTAGETEAERAPLRTIFVGGGTPTLLPVELWTRVLGALGGSFDLSLMQPGGRASPGEFTVECNPETATAALMAALASGGVNRLSIGAQSFDARHLKTLERWHDPANVARAIGLAREAGIERLSVDLIYAIPGQTVAEALDDIDRAVDLGVEHVSAYSLTYEPGTAMTARLNRGEFAPTDEETDAEMFESVAERLAAHGFRRYETSNFAFPGAECRHNLAYWRQRDWIAVGPSASAHLAGHRWKNAPRLGTYLGAFEREQPCPVVDLETPDARRALAERIMTGLRLSDGLDAGSILAGARAIDPRLVGSLRGAIAGLRADGLIRHRGTHRFERWILSRDGEILADRIAAGLMAVVDP